MICASAIILQRTIVPGVLELLVLDRNNNNNNNYNTSEAPLQKHGLLARTHNPKRPIIIIIIPISFPFYPLGPYVWARVCCVHNIIRALYIVYVCGSDGYGDCGISFEISPSTHSSHNTDGRRR